MAPRAPNDQPRRTGPPGRTSISEKPDPTRPGPLPREVDRSPGWQSIQEDPIREPLTHNSQSEARFKNDPNRILATGRIQTRRTPDVRRRAPASRSSVSLPKIAASLARKTHSRGCVPWPLRDGPPARRGLDDHPDPTRLCFMPGTRRQDLQNSVVIRRSERKTGGMADKRNLVRVADPVERRKKGRRARRGRRVASRTWEASRGTICRVLPIGYDQWLRRRGRIRAYEVGSVRRP